MINKVLENYWLRRLSFWLAMEESLLRDVHILLCQRHVNMWRTGIYETED